MVRRRKNQQAEQPEAVEQAGDAAPAGVRAGGPWDAAERQPGPDYADLGSLLVRGREGIEIQMPTEGDTDTIGSVVLVSDDSALELRAFAATRSGGLWGEVRDDLMLEVTRLDGQCEQVDGAFGPELRVRVPVALPDQQEAFQPSRIIGIEGPRWLLRATFLGAAGLEPSDEGLLMESLRDVIVVRGDEPRIPREPLLLRLPDNAIVTRDEE